MGGNRCHERMYDHDMPRRASFSKGIENILSEFVLTSCTGERSFLHPL
jgi:hypothetical protein